MTHRTPCPHRITADWLLPVDGPPIACGGVLVGADGRIVAVGPDAALPAPPGATAEHHAGAVLLPGLVNTHTHLELTGLAGAVTAADFPEWIRGIIAVKAARTPDDVLAAARQGVADCLAAGVTTVADCGDSGQPIRAMAEGGIRGIAYHEVFGPHPEQVEVSMAGLRARVAELRAFESPRVRLGVSPHAPYSVSGPLYAAAARWARAEGLPLAVHVAESAAESALLQEARGGFAEAWTRRGIPLPTMPGRSPVAWLEAHGVLGDDTLCIHVIRADAADVARLRAHDCGVAHCPLSNDRHGHGAAPLAALRDAGLRVGLGTDSVVSVDRLDLLGEARAARALAGLDADETLALCTADGARALGLDEEIGTLTPGKWADLVAVRLAPDATAAEQVVEAVLAGGPADVRATYVAGRALVRR